MTQRTEGESWGELSRKECIFSSQPVKNVMGLFLENILLALFSSFRLNQLAIHGRRRFGFLVGGDLSFRVECRNQHGPDLVLTVSALDARDPEHHRHLGAR